MGIGEGDETAEAEACPLLGWLSGVPCGQADTKLCAQAHLVLVTTQFAAGGTSVTDDLK